MAQALLKEQGKKVIAIVNQKGGVGKTTSVLTLGSGLALAGQKVLLLDADPQANLSLFFTQEPLSMDFFDLIRNSQPGMEAVDGSRLIVPEVRPNLSLLPIFQKTLRTDISDEEIRNSLPVLRQRMEEWKLSYDWILIDCSPSSSWLERLAIALCDTVVIPLEFQLFSVAGLDAVLEEVKKTSDWRGGAGIDVDFLLFTKAENRLTRVHDYRKLFSEFRIPIFEVCKSEYLPRSVELGKTLWECAPSSIAAHDYLNVIEKRFIG